jgi:simple sugar transport system permease protein
MRISPNLIPLLAVLTAFMIGIPLMMLTENSVGGGLRTAGMAYSALIEGMFGVAINDVATMDNFSEVTDYVQSVELSKDGLTRQARPIERVQAIGADNINIYEALLAKYPDLTDEELEVIGPAINPMRDIGIERVRATGALIAQLDADGLTRSQVKSLTTLVARKSSLSAEEIAEAAALWSPIGTMDNATLTTTLDYLNLMNTYTAASMGDFATVLARLESLGIDVNGEEASQLRDLTLSDPSRVREAVETLKTLEAAGVSNPAVLGEELRLLGNLYSAGVLTSETVNEAISSGELERLLNDALIVRRPGDNNLIGLGQGSSVSGQLIDSQNQPVYYLRVGDNAALFVPALLNSSILKSIPYIIIGVAVGLGFAAGVFNIGAEGQLHMGAIAAAWIGVALVGVSPFVHIPAVLLAGMLGGLLWGGIPGVLKAFTGASEVVVTIMMNFIAALFIDWLIKQDPPVLRDPASSIPRTPPIEMSAHLPTFSQLPFWVFLLIGAAVFAVVLISQRQRTGRALIRPIVLGVFTVLVSVFIQFINIPDRIHIGFFFVFVVVFGADWFLMRTTPGFELRTVGINQSAARYAGMSVALNVVLAMGISGMLAGFAGAVEVSGREFAMVPGLFLGYGFDSISVALLARKNPRSMLWSGFLWGGLLSAAGLMQIRADVSIDLVKIIQALIIMFVAADQIIRFIYRIPKTTDESKLIFSAK